MSRDASVGLDWADGHYTFRLSWGQLIELQEKLDAGPSYILDKLWKNEWKVQYISEIIRLGLIGGGETPTKALSLTKNYVQDRPPLENLSLSQAILAIALTGAPDEEPGEAQAAQILTESITSLEVK